MQDALIMLGVLVAWFHDAIYDPRATDNEARSADVARDVCRGLGLAAPHTDVVVELIEAPAYRAGRSLILRSFLDREQIYATPLARREWTCAARSNVDRELARLAR